MEPKSILITGFILLLSVGLWPLESLADNPVEHEKITLLSAIERISQQYDVYFTFDMTLVSEVKVEYEYKEYATAEEAVSAILRGTDLKYKFYDQRFVILYKKGEEGLESLKKMSEHLDGLIGEEEKTITSAPKREIRALPRLSSRLLSREIQRIAFTVEGKVIDQEGEPLIGVNIQVKGTNKGTSTDFEGNFILADVDENAVLVLSYVGYQIQEINVSGRSNLIIRMVSNSQLLDEVVVTGFGLSQRKESLTSAIAVIGAEEISRSSASTSSGALVGKIAGINSRMPDGRPGASTMIQIRNMGDPLYVIDGIQSDAGQFNNIDFNDIESLSVLKDASASIYGVRAANGVIVVTTKKGSRNQKNTISVNSYYGWQSLFTFPKPATAETYIKNYIQSETITGATNYTYPKEEYEKWLSGTEKGYVPFDWYDYIFEVAPQTYLNVNASGGSENINYYVSVGQLNQDAMIVNYGGFDRTNIQMNVNASITERLKVGMGMNGRVEHRINPGVPGGDDYWLPRFGTYRNLPTRRPFANDNPNYPTLTSTDPGTNFAWLTYDLSGKWEQTWRVGQLNFDLEYEIIDGLKFKALGSYYLANERLDNQEYTYKLYGYDEKEDTYPVIFENTNPWRERTQGFVEEVTSNVQIAYSKNIGSNYINAFIGAESIQRKSPSIWVHSIPTSNALHLIDYETMDTYDDTGSREEARLGYLGRLNYDYGGRYLLEISGRYDGSWKFPPDHRWGFFPSASLGWRLSEEPFWKDGSKFSNLFYDLKVRGSYGLLGDDNVPGYNPFDYMSGYTYKSGGSVIDDKYVLGTVARGLPVTTLTWIKALILDVGIDASFINGKLSSSFDFFRRKRTGLPASRYDILIPSEVGFSLPSENLNSDVHMGYDFEIIWNDRVGDFGYVIGANATYSRFYDWERYKPRYSNSWDIFRNSLEKRYGYLNWGLEAVGQFESWEEIANWPVDNDRQGNRTLRPGDVKYKDVNGDGVINYLDERPIGYRQDATPIFNFGLNFRFDWKGFDLAFDLTGGALSTWYQEWEQRNPFHDGGNNPQYYMEDTWRLADIWNPESELIPGKYPTLLVGNSSHSNYWNSTFWKKNVRYLKLRNLEFGYTLPDNILEKTRIPSLRVYLAGQNVFGLTNLIGVDPEIMETNGLAYPTPRIINIGLNIKF